MPCYDVGGLRAVQGGFALHFDESASISAPIAFGTYRVLHQAGSGVLGPVFRAFDPQGDTLVAVKAFKLDIIPEAVVRFADRLRRLAACPVTDIGLVPIIGVGLEGTAPYLVMPYQSGETLDVALRRLAPLPLEETVALVAGLAAAIDQAWAAGVGHGSLHPRDVFVGGIANRVAVTGFGVAQALQGAGLDAPLRRPYVAPERSGHSWDIRADLYSLGAITHELLTARRPSATGEQDGVFVQGLSPAARVELRRVLAAALAPVADERPESGAAFIAALEAVGRDLAPATARRAASRPVPAPREVVEPEHPARAVSPPALEEAAEIPNHAAVGRLIAQADVPPAETAVRRVPPPAIAVSPTPAAPRRTSPWLKAALFAGGGLVAGALGGLVLATPWLPTAEVAGVSGDAAAAEGPASPSPDDVAVVAAARTTAAAGDAIGGPAQPAVAPPRAGPSATAPGRLVIRSEPSGALVTIDGRRAGATPLVMRDLELGSYRVAVAHPGHVPWTDRVTLGSRAPARTLAVTLVPGLEPVAATRGAIDVDSRPRGARVVVDNRFVGHAPLRLVDVTPGEHLVRLELGGHVPAEGRVYVAGGRPAPIRLTLRPVVSSGGYGQ